ncbi:MAG: methylated-DNA--[protein]-cysteine S-methyltransferase [Gammaproteobacteria bacterium]|nr:MAG: methylated-DNA--[protein]-cysteine S-methyltransferase [Gammaproteobacteria bacterium]
MVKKIVINSPLGRLGIRLHNEQILKLDFLEDNYSPQKPRDRFAHEVVRQLDAYFSDANFQFNLPVDFAGTLFQQKVWKMLQAIRCGQTYTYGELARKLDSGARAVGNACRKNPVPIIVPCHRVVSRNKIGGYSGQTDGKFIDYKHWLLQHEGSGLKK